MAGWAGGMALNAPWHSTGGTLQATSFTTDVMVGEHLSPGSLPTLGNVPVTRLRIVPKEKDSRPCSIWVQTFQLEGLYSGKNGALWAAREGQLTFARKNKKRYNQNTPKTA